MEYRDASVTLRSGIYGRIFFFSTGFHGLHVIFGSIFLLFNFYRIAVGHYRMFRHLGFEFAILY
jgi:heme/copper-type cytochrome/quinol oxidase subunit 3